MWKVVEDVKGSDENEKFFTSTRNFFFLSLLTSYLHAVLYFLSVVMGLKTLQKIERRESYVMDAFQLYILVTTFTQEFLVINLFLKYCTSSLLVDKRI